MTVYGWVTPSWLNRAHSSSWGSNLLNKKRWEREREREREREDTVRQWERDRSVGQDKVHIKSLPSTAAAIHQCRVHDTESTHSRHWTHCNWAGSEGEPVSHMHTQPFDPYWTLVVAGSVLDTAAPDISAWCTVESAGCTTVEGCLGGRDDELASTARMSRIRHMIIGLGKTPRAMNHMLHWLVRIGGFHISHAETAWLEVWGQCTWGNMRPTKHSRHEGGRHDCPSPLCQLGGPSSDPLNLSETLAANRFKLVIEMATARTHTQHLYTHTHTVSPFSDPSKHTHAVHSEEGIITVKPKRTIKVLCKVKRKYVCILAACTWQVHLVAVCRPSASTYSLASPPWNATHPTPNHHSFTQLQNHYIANKCVRNFYLFLQPWDSLFGHHSMWVSFIVQIPATGNAWQHQCTMHNHNQTAGWQLAYPYCCKLPQTGKEWQLFQLLPPVFVQEQTCSCRCTWTAFTEYPQTVHVVRSINVLRILLERWMNNEIVTDDDDHGDDTEQHNEHQLMHYNWAPHTMTSYVWPMFMHKYMVSKKIEVQSISEWLYKWQMVTICCDLTAFAIYHLGHHSEIDCKDCCLACNDT